MRQEEGQNNTLGLGVEFTDVTTLCNQHSLYLIFFRVYQGFHNLKSRKSIKTKK